MAESMKQEDIDIATNENRPVVFPEGGPPVVEKPKEYGPGGLISKAEPGGDRVVLERPLVEPETFDERSPATPRVADEPMSFADTLDRCPHEACGVVFTRKFTETRPVARHDGVVVCNRCVRPIEPAVAPGERNLEKDPP